MNTNSNTQTNNDEVTKRPYRRTGKHSRKQKNTDSTTENTHKKIVDVANLLIALTKEQRDAVIKLFH